MAPTHPPLAGGTALGPPPTPWWSTRRHRPRTPNGVGPAGPSLSSVGTELGWERGARRGRGRGDDGAGRLRPASGRRRLGARPREGRRVVRERRRRGKFALNPSLAAGDPRRPGAETPGIEGGERGGVEWRAVGWFFCGASMYSRLVRFVMMTIGEEVFSHITAPTGPGIDRAALGPQELVELHKVHGEPPPDRAVDPGAALAQGPLHQRHRSRQDHVRIHPAA